MEPDSTSTQPPPTRRLNDLVRRLQNLRKYAHAPMLLLPAPQVAPAPPPPVAPPVAPPLASQVGRGHVDEQIIINGRDVNYLRKAFLEASIAEYRQSVLASLPASLASSAAVAVASAAVSSKYKLLTESLRKKNSVAKFTTTAGRM